MTTPWLDDACSLVDAFRAGDTTPREVLDASLDAISSSSLNAFSFLDEEGARQAAEAVDVSLPWGGVPIGVKELDAVEGWPQTEASLVFKDRRAAHTHTQVRRLRDAGAVLVGLTTASEFGFVNYTSTRLNGVTRNPWDPARTPGGSSGGAAAAVAGGLVPLSTGGDGGGSIRIPSGFCGLPGLKTTFGRIPRGPHEITGSLTVTVGPLCRSVRDIARWLDVCNGYDAYDRFSLPRVEGWEAGLGTRDVSGLTVAVAPDLQGTAVVHPAIVERVEQAAAELISSAGLKRVDATIEMPEPGPAWGLAGLVSAVVEFGHLSPEEMAEHFTMEMGALLPMVIPMYNAQHGARVETYRVEMIDAMARVWDQVDLLICATNPDAPFAAEGPVPSSVGDVLCNPFNAGALTIPGNITGCPGISIPIGTDGDGRPIGMQVYAPHYREDVLLELALRAEREHPWPLVAPGAPA